MENLISSVLIFRRQHHAADLSSQSIGIQSRIVAYISSDISALCQHSHFELFRHVLCSLQGKGGGQSDIRVGCRTGHGSVIGDHIRIAGGPGNAGRAGSLRESQVFGYIARVQRQLISVDLNIAGRICRRYGHVKVILQRHASG